MVSFQLRRIQVIILGCLFGSLPFVSGQQLQEQVEVQLVQVLQAMESFRALVGSQYTLAYTPLAGTQRSKWRKIKASAGVKTSN